MTSHLSLHLDVWMFDLLSNLFLMAEIGVQINCLFFQANFLISFQLVFTGFILSLLAHSETWFVKNIII